MHVKKYGKENLKLLAVAVGGLVFNTCWYIYGNVIYFKYKDVCWNESAGLTQSMQLMVMLSYIVFMKCFCLSICLCVCVPIIVTSIRRQQRPNWIGAAPNIMKNLLKEKFDPTKAAA